VSSEFDKEGSIIVNINIILPLIDMVIHEIMVLGRITLYQLWLVKID
jgi:hypothetical protein